MICFEIPGEPKGKGRHRVQRVGNKIHSYTPESTVEYENFVKLCYMQSQNKEAFNENVPLLICIYAYFSMPKSISKKKRELMLSREIRPTKKPDCDNIAKIICDALNGLAYHDDKQIVECVVKKYYSERPRVVVNIQEARNE